MCIFFRPSWPVCPSDGLREFIQRFETSKDVNLFCVGKKKKKEFPTSPFPIVSPQNPWINPCVVQERRATDFKTHKLGKAGKSDTAKKTALERAVF